MGTTVPGLILKPSPRKINRIVHTLSTFIVKMTCNQLKYVDK